MYILSLHAAEKLNIGKVMVLMVNPISRHTAVNYLPIRSQFYQQVHLKQQVEQ